MCILYSPRIFPGKKIVFRRKATAKNGSPTHSLYFILLCERKKLSKKHCVQAGGKSLDNKLIALHRLTTELCGLKTSNADSIKDFSKFDVAMTCPLQLCSRRKRKKKYENHRGPLSPSLPLSPLNTMKNSKGKQQQQHISCTRFDGLLMLSIRFKHSIWTILPFHPFFT